MKVGYGRVSTGLQNLDLQEDSLKSAGCEKIFLDKISGVKKKREGLQAALDFIRPGDTLLVWRLDRLGRNMQELIQIVNGLNEKGISYYSLQENITMDKKNSTGQLMFHLFAAFAEFERNLILERSAAGREAARARGRLGGRPEKFTAKDLEMLQTLVSSGTPIKDIAAMWNVSRTTIYRYLRNISNFKEG
jgi:DNA invertase Pin-like site-specific DNA recombinase